MWSPIYNGVCIIIWWGIVIYSHLISTKLFENGKIILLSILLLPVSLVSSTFLHSLWAYLALILCVLLVLSGKRVYGLNRNSKCRCHARRVRWTIHERIVGENCLIEPSRWRHKGEPAASWCFLHWSFSSLVHLTSVRRIKTNAQLKSK